MDKNTNDVTQPEGLGPLPSSGAARRVMDAVIGSNLMTAQCAHDDQHGVICVWSSGAEEQLEAIIREDKHKEAMNLLGELHEWMADIEEWPPGDWLKRMFLLDGSHMALVEDPDEGMVWHTYADAVSSGHEIIEEVNAPQS